MSVMLLLSATSLYATPLDDARSAGQIVELPSGYTEATASASMEVKSLAADVNAKRRIAYGKIARKNGIDIKTVAVESYLRRRKKL